MFGLAAEVVVDDCPGDMMPAERMVVVGNKSAVSNEPMSTDVVDLELAEEKEDDVGGGRGGLVTKREEQSELVVIVGVFG